MDILKKICDWAVTCPNRIAVKSRSGEITYKELWRYSDHLADWLLKNTDGDRSPVAVYGHKHPWMLVCFLACVKSGRAYCPIDVSVPDARVESILQALPSKIILATEQTSVDAGGKRVVGLEELQKILSSTVEEVSGTVKAADEAEISGSANAADEATVSGGANAADEAAISGDAKAGTVPEDMWVRGDETYYIIFTSGSTGTPKGVQITADCLGHYLDWSVTLGSSAQEKQGQVFLNQAPFSFDLSVMDLYTSLAVGGTLYCLEKSVQSDYRALVQELKESGANVWVSTPSFAEICLSERTFSQEMMPGLQVFLFCGETLANKTAGKLQQRFPNAKIVNTYGPTESTVAVTDVLITPELAGQEQPLPVGRPKMGTYIEIRDEDGKSLPEGEKGEIVIIGNTVSTGYYGRADLTEKSFFCCDGMRGYHTGDKGYLQDGMLYYCGRIDLQIKLHGYRIELEDIENNIARVPQIEQAAVVPNYRRGKVSSLTAYVVKCADNNRSEVMESGKCADTGNAVSESGQCADKVDAVSESGQCADKAGAAVDVRSALKQFLPDYMIPKKIVFLDKMPVTNNGKVNRKLLAEGSLQPDSEKIRSEQCGGKC